MAQLVVRNLDEDVRRRLRERADRHGHGMEDEVREILRAAAIADIPPSGLPGTRIARRFACLGLAEELPHLRGQVARPAEFEE
jgi:antitoxin FitA